MDKIQLLALKSIIKDNVDLIIELIENSTNPEVAVLVTLGLYEKPDLTMGDNISSKDEYENIQFVSYNKYEDTVNFSGNRVTKKYAWTNNKTGETVSTKESSYYACDQVNMTKEEFERLHTRTIVERTVSTKSSIINVTRNTWINNK